MNGLTGTFTACFLASRPRFQPRCGCDAQERAPARGPLTWSQLPASFTGPYPPHSAGNVASSRALHPGIRLLFLSDVRPSLAQPMGQRHDGPTAVTERQRARPARRRARRPRIRAPRGAEKRSRRERPGAGLTQEPRQPKWHTPPRSSEPPGPHRPYDRLTSAQDNGGRSPQPGVDRNAPRVLLGVVVLGGALPVWADAPQK